MAPGDRHQTFTPVEVPSTLEQTLERLGRAIQLGVLKPGEQLPPERELADRLQISRTTLRQALAELIGSGHLVALRGRTGGTFVTDHPPLALPRPLPPRHTHAELADLRTMHEVGSATLAAERQAPEGLAGMDAAIRAHRAAGHEDPVGFLRADAAFHLALVRATGNARMERSAVELHSECSSLIVSRIREAGLLPGVVQRSLGEHEELLGAIRAGDGARAASAARRHMRILDDWLRDAGISRN